MSTEIVTYEAMPLEQRMSYANTIAGAAAMLPNGIRAGDPGQTAANAFLIMETGAMLDLHPIAALSSVNIIEGKPALSADLMVSVVRNAGHTVRVTEEGSVESGDYKATVTVVRADDPEYPTVSVWTPHRAARAGLCSYTKDDSGMWQVVARSSKGNPLPWQLYTEALCKARAKAEACRDGGGDTLNGARYTPEELGSDIDAHGDPIVTRLGAADAAPEVDSKPSALPPATKRATTGKQGTRRKPAKKAEEAAPAHDESIVDAEVVEEPKAPETPAEEPPAAKPEPTPEPEPVAPVQAVEDSGLSEERAERERMAAEQMRQVSEREQVIATADQVDRADEAAVKAWNAEHGKATGHYLTSDAEIARERAKMEPAPEEDDGPQFVDSKTGDVYDTQAELDAALHARVQADISTDAGQVVGTISADDDAEVIEDYDTVTSEEPKNYLRRAAAAVTVDQAKQIWVDAQADTENPMTTEVRLAIVNRKAEIEGQA